MHNDARISIKTSRITVNQAAIDWEKIHSLGQFVVYNIPGFVGKRWDYLHNWYLGISQYPYYLHSPTSRLYIKYPLGVEPTILRFQDQQLKPDKINIGSVEAFPNLLKVLISDFFFQRSLFVSNNDFYLLVRTTQENISAKVLKLTFAQQWRDNRYFDFEVFDEATTLRRVSAIPNNPLHGGMHGLDHRDGIPILRRIHPKHAVINESTPLYTRRSHTNYRTLIPYFSMKNELALNQSRMAVVWRFMQDILVYFQSVGMPFQLSDHIAERVSNLHGKAMDRHQIDLNGIHIAVFDDRLRPKIAPDLEPSDFHHTLINEIKTIVGHEWSMAFSPKTSDQLTSTDMVLRLQDNDASDFRQPETEHHDDIDEGIVAEPPPLLARYEDPYQGYYSKFGSLTTQSINVNYLTKVEEASEVDSEEENDMNEDVDASQDHVNPQTVTDYMQYGILRRSKFTIPLLNSIYQLFLKYLVRNPINAAKQLPLLQQMKETIFLHAEGLVYLDEDTLRFLPTVNNEEAARLISNRTGWSLDEDILIPALERNSYNSLADIDNAKLDRLLKNGYFMVNRSHVWQIEECKERILYNVDSIRDRLQAQYLTFNTEILRPTYTSDELGLFTYEQLRAFDRYLDEHVGTTISFYELTRIHGKSGLYDRLGIKKSDRIKQYFELKGIRIESPKGSDVIPGYVGIWAISETQQYYVGDKNSIKYTQERGYVLRRVITHRNKSISDTATENHNFAQFQKDFFPLLSVNFIRYHQYTVVPFPFRLITMWLEEERRTRTITKYSPENGLLSDI